jgi:hypothetical protein
VEYLCALLSQRYRCEAPVDKYTNYHPEYLIITQVATCSPEGDRSKAGRNVVKWLRGS